MIDAIGDAVWAALALIACTWLGVAIGQGAGAMLARLGVWTRDREERR